MGPVTNRILQRSDCRSDTNGEANSRRRLITLIEMYSLRQIEPPPAERFRFDNQDAEVNFVNETDRYVESYGVI